MKNDKLVFEWNQEKALLNLNKHNISFEEAETVFDDEFAAFIHDYSHSYSEDRFILIGYSNKNNLLFVSFIERSGKIRLISSRKATKSERKRHEENYKKY